MDDREIYSFVKNARELIEGLRLVFEEIEKAK